MLFRYYCILNTAFSPGDITVIPCPMEVTLKWRKERIHSMLGEEYCEEK